MTFKPCYLCVFLLNVEEENWKLKEMTIKEMTFKPC